MSRRRGENRQAPPEPEAFKAAREAVRAGRVQRDARGRLIRVLSAGEEQAPHSGASVVVKPARLERAAVVVAHETRDGRALPEGGGRGRSSGEVAAASQRPGAARRAVPLWQALFARRGGRRV